MANVWINGVPIETALSVISGPTPYLRLDDTDAAAKDMILYVDGNKAAFYEASAGAAGDILTLDLANKRVGIGTNSPAVQFDLSGTAPVMQISDTTASAKSLRVAVDANVASLYEAAGAATDIMQIALATNVVTIKSLNASGTVSTIAKHNASGIVDSVVNAAGYLKNDGAGAFSWDTPTLTHAMLSATHTDSTASAVARGSIITGQGGTPAWVALTVGAANSVLTANGTDVAWSATPTIGSATVGGTLTVSPTEGPELLSNGAFTTDATSWTVGAAWQWASSAVQKFQNGTTTLAHTAATCAAGSFYKLTFTISGWSTGSVQATVGGQNHSNTYGANGTYTIYFRASDTTSVVFTPTDGARFVIDDVSLKLVTLGTLTADGLVASNYIQLLSAVGSTTYGNYYIRPDNTGFLSFFNGNNSTYAYVKAFQFNGTNSVSAPTITASTVLAGPYYTAAGGVVGITTAGGVMLGSGVGVGWSSTTDHTVSKDTLLSRISAGVLGLGTGAVGDYAGTLKCGFLNTIAVDGALTTATTVLTCGHNSSGTPGIGFGITKLFNLHSTTTVDQSAGAIDIAWVEATHNTRKASMKFSVYDTAVRECLKIQASGAAGMIGFLGATPIVRPTALTAALTAITHTSPTPDYAIQDLVQNTGFGFVTKDEGNTVLSVILNLQTRVGELEAKLGSAAGLGLITTT